MTVAAVPRADLRCALAARRPLRAAALLALLLSLFSAGALVQGAPDATARARNGHQVERVPTAIVKAVQRELGLHADGVIGPRTRRAIRRFQRRRGLTVDGVIGPQTLRALGIASGASVGRGESVSATLERIAQCESGGNPRAVSPDGRYRGKYQFGRDTWRSLGGHGDPARAPEAEQDRRAAKLLARSGTSPWPNCG